MSHAFAKDSRACAACVSWGGERALAADNTLVHVARYNVEGECRTAVSQDYRKITKAYHTCEAWAPLPMMKAHGARPARSPGPSAAMAGVLAATPAGRSAAGRSAVGAPAPEAADADAEEICSAAPLDVDKAPPGARQLYVHWHRKRGQRPMPTAAEIDTAQIRDSVSRICLMAPAPGGADFVYRSCGRALQRRLGFRPAGRLVAACHPEEAARRFLTDLRACLASGEARCLLVRGDPILPGVRFVELLLPLADERGRPALVLAYRHVPGG